MGIRCRTILHDFAASCFLVLAGILVHSITSLSMCPVEGGAVDGESGRDCRPHIALGG